MIDKNEDHGIWEKAAELLNKQPMYQPNPVIEQKILSRVQIGLKTFHIKPHPYALIIALTLLIILWSIIRPGIVLQWTIADIQLNDIRIYRTVQGREEFQIIYEARVQNRSNVYTFTDLLILPWQTYTYVLNGYNQDGISIASQQVIGRAVEALPGQLALISASLFTGYLVIYLFEAWRSNRKEYGKFIQGKNNHLN